MKKKLAVVTLIAATMAMALSACSVSVTDTTKNADGKYFNNKYSEETMVTVTGEKQDMTEDAVRENATAGFAFVTPEEWSGITNEKSLYVQNQGEAGTIFAYIPPEDIEKLDTITDDMTDEEKEDIMEEAYSNFFAFAVMYRTNPNMDEDECFDDAQLEELGMKVDEVYTAGDDTYKLAYMTEAPADIYTEQDLKEIQMFIDSKSKLEDNMILFTPVDPVENFKVDLTSFKTTDLDGNEVTQDIFKDHDVTMVNVYATWCQYCIEEMPYIEKLYEGRDSNVNVIGICMDGADETETAKKELEQTGVTYPVLIANEELTEKFGDNITGYPTTFFVNSKGEIIGSLQVGAPGTDEQTVIDGYTALINEALGK